MAACRPRKADAGAANRGQWNRRTFNRRTKKGSVFGALFEIYEGFCHFHFVQPIFPEALAAALLFLRHRRFPPAYRFVQLFFPGEEVALQHHFVAVDGHHALARREGLFRAVCFPQPGHVRRDVEKHRHVSRQNGDPARRFRDGERRRLAFVKLLVGAEHNQMKGVHARYPAMSERLPIK